uniref:Uncharacterized protein n=1 Tax=Glossina brevipalpis TaxID=37001 RepID=A0A1A9WPQ4_9MUSC
MDRFKYLYFVLLLIIVTVCECDGTYDDGPLTRPGVPQNVLFIARNQYSECGRRHDGRPIKCKNYGLSRGLA